MKENTDVFGSRAKRVWCVRHGQAEHNVAIAAEVAQFRAEGREWSLAVSQAARMPIVSAAELQSDREAATERGGYVDSSLAKMKSAESSFELFLSEFPLDAAEPYPPVDKLVDYASWCSRTRSPLIFLLDACQVHPRKAHVTTGI